MDDSREPNSISTLVLDALAAGGVEPMFGLPGVHNLLLWESARTRRDLSMIGVRHEQAAVYAADGYGRLTGRPAAALTTTGPGAANAVAAFGEAASCCSPVVLLSTEIAGRAQDKPGSFGRVHGSPDQASMFTSFAKGVFRPRAAGEVVRAVSDAVQLATELPQGPVYVDIPADLLACDGISKPSGGSPDGKIESADVAGIIPLVEASERPLLWAGGGAATPQASAVVGELAHRLGAPVLTTFAGRGVVAPSHPSWIGLPCHEPEVMQLMAEADLLLGFGSAFDGMNTRNWDLPFPTNVVSVNLQDTHLVEEGVPHQSVRGEVAAVGSALLEEPSLHDARPVWADLPALRERAWRRIRREDMTESVSSVLGSVNSALTQGQTVIADMAIAGYWTAGYASPQRPRQLLYPVGWGTLGFALPASIGVAWSVRNARQRCLVVCGDGGLMFALGELATIKEHNLPVTILMVDDGGYGMLRYDQVALGMEPYGVDLRTPDFAALFAAFGIPVINADGDDQVALEKAICGLPDDFGPQAVVVRAALPPPRTTSPRWREPVTTSA